MSNGMPRQARFEETLAGLSQHYVGDMTLDATLLRIATLGMDAVPPTASIGITVLTDGRGRTTAFTDPEVPEVDEAQYSTGDGPCLDAARQNRSFVIDSTCRAGPWQAFRDAARCRGIMSTMSLPLHTTAEPIGAMNFYATVEHAYGDAELEIGTLFACHAGFLIANAKAYWDARVHGEHLEIAIESRAVIEQAKGIVMASMRCTDEEAFEQLVRQSQHENIKLREVAASIVRQATRRW